MPFGKYPADFGPPKKKRRSSRRAPPSESTVFIPPHLRRHKLSAKAHTDARANTGQITRPAGGKTKAAESKERLIKIYCNCHWLGYIHAPICMCARKRKNYWLLMNMSTFWDSQKGEALTRPGWNFQSVSQS